MNTFALLALTLSAPVFANEDRLEISRVQSLYSVLGPQRMNDVYYPRDDQLIFLFRVDGAKANSNRLVDLDVATSIKNPQGRVLNLKTISNKAVPLLGHDPVWLYAVLPLTDPLDEGDYTAHISVIDNLTQRSANFERPVKVRPKDFGLKSLLFFADKEKKILTAPRFQIGQSIHLKAMLEGIDGSFKRVDIGMKVRFLDGETGKDFSREETAYHLREPTNSEIGSATFHFDSHMLMREGRFLLRITFNDVLADKECVYELPFTVAPPETDRKDK